MARTRDQPEVQGSISFVEAVDRLGRVNSLLLRLLPGGLADGDQLRRALIAAAVGVLLLLMAPFYGLLAWALEAPPTLYYVLALEAFVAAAVALLCLRGGFMRVASFILLAGATVAILGVFLREGASSPAASNFVIVIVMAALLIGWRAVLVLGALTAVLVVTFQVLELRGVFHPPPRSASGGVFVLVQVTSLTIMLVIFDRVRLGLLRARRDLEEKLGEVHRLEAVGRLAGGIAHDFNNLLTVILASVEMMEHSDAPTTVKEDAGAIRVAAARAAALTKQLLAFSRQQKLETTTFDLGGLLDEVQGMLRRVIPETVRIETGRFPAVVWIRADPSQLTQVIMNLAVNARDAMPGGGTLRIAAAYAENVVLPPTLAIGRYVRLEIGDSGVGMDLATRERVFEPFFTTKSAGTGLGLATVHGIVTQSGGAIRVTSEPGAGSTFEVFLPAAEPPEPADALRAVSARRVGPTAVVLLVEDNDQVRAATARMLRLRGREVVECHGAEEARRMWAIEGPRIDVVLSDVVMPDGDGPAMVATLAGVRVSRVIFMSGYLDRDLRGALPPGSAFIAKPFAMKDLDQKIEEALASDSVGARAKN